MLILRHLILPLTFVNSVCAPSPFCFIITFKRLLRQDHESVTITRSLLLSLGHLPQYSAGRVAIIILGSGSLFFFTDRQVDRQVRRSLISNLSLFSSTNLMLRFLFES